MSWAEKNAAETERLRNETGSDPVAAATIEVAIAIREIGGAVVAELAKREKPSS